MIFYILDKQLFCIDKAQILFCPAFYFNIKNFINRLPKINFVSIGVHNMHKLTVVKRFDII